MVDTAPEEIQLSDSERDKSLDRVDTGVLSLSTPPGEAPHSVPVSLGYNAAQTAFYFRVADLPPGEKAELDGRVVTSITYSIACHRKLLTVCLSNSCQDLRARCKAHIQHYDLNVCSEIIAFDGVCTIITSSSSASGPFGSSRKSAPPVGIRNWIVLPADHTLES